MSAMPGSLGVVRAEIAPGHYVVSLPQPRALAVDQATDLVAMLADRGDTSSMVAFDRGDGLECWIRAARVLTVDVVSTEDPSVHTGASA